MFSPTDKKYRPRQRTKSVPDPTTYVGGQYARSLGHYSEMIQLDPEDPQAYRGRGIVHLREGNSTRRSGHNSVRRQSCFDKAIMDFTSAIRFAPKDASLHVWRGIAFRKRGQLDEAIADFAEAIRLSPKSSRAYVERSRAHRQKGEMDKAEADRAKAHQLAQSLW